MAENTADDGVGEIDVCDIVAAAIDQGKPLSAEDIAEFDRLLESPDLSEEQRREFLQTVWNIVVAFIDYAHGDHPIQLALKASGKLTKIDSDCDIQSDNMIQSKHNKLTDKYKKAAE